MNEQDQQIRSFVAILLERSVRSELEKAARELEPRAALVNARWVRAENYHVTLNFLGSIGAARVSGILEALRHSLSGMKQFELRAERVGWFPSARRTRILAAEFLSSADLLELSERVSTGLKEVGFEVEERPFRGHVTLARFRQALRQPPAIDLELHSSMQVEAVALMQSQLASSGATYTSLGEVRLSRAERSERGGKSTEKL